MQLPTRLSSTRCIVIFPQVGYPVLLVDIYPLYSAHLTGDTLRGYLGALDSEIVWDLHSKEECDA